MTVNSPCNGLCFQNRLWCILRACPTHKDDWTAICKIYPCGGDWISVIWVCTKNCQVTSTSQKFWVIGIHLQYWILKFMIRRPRCRWYPASVFFWTWRTKICCFLVYAPSVTEKRRLVWKLTNGYGLLVIFIRNMFGSETSALSD